MCCFSKPVNSVAQTKIFARLLTRQDQSIAYQMRLDTPEDVAMILPLPIIEGSKEDSVKFIDLSGYEDFFKDLKKGFPEPPTLSRSKYDSKEPQVDKLKVRTVGSFEASFIPTVADFSRLDKRFKLPEGTWEKIPAYKNYGFAVFKLKKGSKKIHPMALSFPSSLAQKAQLFFPTVHIHDGEIHAKESFDHQLYAQTWLKAGLRGKDGWEESQKLASQFTKVDKAQKLIWGGGHVYLREIRGRQKNVDVIARPVAIGG
ncbi:MAG: hypothetical protein ABF379_03680 [Akkermansiaceae bacterium]|jgi:hypothetical protein